MITRVNNTVRLFIGTKLYGERKWGVVPSVGHKVMYRTCGVHALAEVTDVVWGGTEHQSIVDVHCRHWSGVKQ